MATSDAQAFINQDKYNQANGITGDNLDLSKLGWVPDPSGQYLVPPNGGGLFGISSASGAPNTSQNSAQNQVRQLYQSILGNSNPDQQGLDYWTNKLNSGMSMSDLASEFQKYATPGTSQYAATHSAQQPTGNTGVSMPSMTSFPTTANGLPDYAALANFQSQYNLNNARQQSNMNNPNYYGPQGSQVRTMNPDGTYNVTQTLNPQLQANYDASNRLQGALLNQAQNLTGNPLSYANAPNAPTFDTSGVTAIPNADANDLAQVRDSVYQQQTQYLDPQFQQAQSDLQSQLANQGIMPGSEAYDRAMNNFNLTKQKAYSDARNNAIQAGGQEQSRLFGIGLQANQAGMNNAVAGFNAGMQSRQEGVNEANALHNSPINDINALKTGSQIQLPSFTGQVGTSIPGVDYINAANLGYNANLAQQNATNAQNTNFTNGLFGLGSAALQGGLFNNIGNWLGNNSNYGNWLSNNSGTMNSNGLSPNDLASFG
jgi:hypothetical protein